MKSALAFVVLGAVNAQNVGNSTPSLRSLLSPRDDVTMSDAPKLKGTYCGWSDHGEGHHCRLTFSGDKMRLEWKKDAGTTGKGCKDGKGPEHACCLCGEKRKMDCKDMGYKVTKGGGALTSGLFSDGYDVHWTDTSCIKKEMGEDKNNPNKVPLRIKIHDSGHLDLLECEQQDDKTCDGGGAKCDAVPNGPDGSGCDNWDGSHATPCRRRAGCHSRGLPVPTDDLDDDHDFEEYDLDDIDIV